MDAYVNSDSIEVFPAVRRSEKYLSQSSQIYEQRYSQIISNANNSDSFIISPKNGTSLSQTTEFEFIIHGYYFKVNLADIISSTGYKFSNLYASIQLDTNNDFNELIGIDNNDNEYTGLLFSDTKPTADNTYSLLILTNSNQSATSGYTTLNTSLTSYMRMDLSTIEIDGGDMDL